MSSCLYYRLLKVLLYQKDIKLLLTATIHIHTPIVLKKTAAMCLLGLSSFCLCHFTEKLCAATLHRYTLSIKGFRLLLNILPIASQ